jgi:hypothetical protein
MNKSLSNGNLQKALEVKHSILYNQNSKNVKLSSILETHGRSKLVEINIQ